MPISNLVLYLFKFNYVILGVIMYEMSIPSLLASILAHNAMSFSLKIASHIIHILSATFLSNDVSKALCKRV